MQLISFEEARAMKKQVKLQNLFQRFKGSYARIYAYVQRYEMTEGPRTALGAMIIDGQQFYLTADDYLRMYPRICAHIIAESLGYATPRAAAIILRDAMETGKNNCEWVYSCYNGNAIRVVQVSIRKRHSHKGYMAEYRQALEIVQQALNTGKEPLFASWF